MKTVLLLAITLMLPAADPYSELQEKRSDLPSSETELGERLHWLWDLAVLADQSRKYELAEAYMLGVHAYLPDDGGVLGTLACYVGKQGRYGDALELTNQGIISGNGDLIQLNMIKATWLAHLDQIDEARALLETIKEPSIEDAQAYEMYHVCNAFYHARITKNVQLVESSVRKAMSNGNNHWAAFFKNDVSFDEMRKDDWFDDHGENHGQKAAQQDD